MYLYIDFENKECGESHQQREIHVHWGLSSKSHFVHVFYVYYKQKMQILEMWR